MEDHPFRAAVAGRIDKSAQGLNCVPGGDDHHASAAPDWRNHTLIAIKLDITERKRAEERICLLAQAVENHAELIAISDPDGRISSITLSFFARFGYKESELIRKLFGKMLISQNNPPHIR